MGACQSAESITDPLEQRLVKAVVEANAKHRQQQQREQQQQGGAKAPHSRQASMASLLLSFGRMRPGFVKVRELHKEACAGGAALEVAALKAQAGVLGLGGLSGPAMAELSQMLASSKRTLGADDLLMVLTIVYFTSPESSGELAPEIVAMLDVVEQAFMHFDTSLDGMLEREELDAVLRHGSEGGHEDAVKRRRHKHKHAGVGERLFDLLDFDHSGRVSFKEFILGMEKLVLSELEEEEEEAQAQQGEQSKALATSSASLAAHANGVPVEAH